MNSEPVVKFQKSPKVRATQARDLAARAERIREAIAILQQEIQRLESSGALAPPETYVMRYKARNAKCYYWYYKLHFLEAVFPCATNNNQLSKYKHLGRAGSEEHINAVMQVARRGKVDVLQRAVSSLYESWLNLNSDSEPESTPST